MGKLWFRTRRYGWGWEPASAEGWIVTLVFMALMAVSTFYFLSRINAGADVGTATVVFLAWAAILVGILIAICWRTGETPRWRWGDD